MKGTSKFLVDILIKPGNSILVFIDADDSVALQDCIDLSRHIESNLDREEEDFSLNVSSHGLDQPLRLLRQYEKNKGRMVNILLTDDSKKKGKLLKANHEALVILPAVTGKNKKKTDVEDKELQIPFDQIRETKVVITFKK